MQNQTNRKITGQSSRPEDAKVPQNRRSQSAEIGRSEVLAQAQKAVTDALNSYPQLVLRDYYRSLGHRNRRNNGPRLKEVKALLDKMRKYSADDKRITVQEVFLLDR